MPSSACIKPDDDAASSDAAGTTEKRSDEGRCHNPSVRRAGLFAGLEQCSLPVGSPGPGPCRRGPARARGPAITLGSTLTRSAQQRPPRRTFSPRRSMRVRGGHPHFRPHAGWRQPNPAHLQEQGTGVAGPGRVKAVRMMRVGWDFGPWQGVRLVCSDQYMFVSAEALAELGFPAAAAGLADLARAGLLARPAPSGPPQASPPRTGTVPGQAPPMTPHRPTFPRRHPSAERNPDERPGQQPPLARAAGYQARG